MFERTEMVAAIHFNRPAFALLQSQTARGAKVDDRPQTSRLLVAARLLKPLGNPQPNSVNYFAVVEIMELAKDRTCWARMTNALSSYWQQKNTSNKRFTKESDRLTVIPD